MEELGQPRQQIIRVGERGPRGRGRGQPRAAARAAQEDGVAQAQEVVPPEPTDPEDAQVAVPCQISGAPTLSTSSDPTYSGSNIARELRPTWSLTFQEVSREQSSGSMEVDNFAFLLQAAEREFTLDSEMEEGQVDPILPQLNESNEECFTPVKTATTTENRDISPPCCEGKDKGNTKADSDDEFKGCWNLTQERCEICSLVTDIQHLSLLDSDYESEVCSHKVEEECEICSLMKSLHQLSIEDLDSESESPVKSSGVSKEFKIFQYCDAMPPASQSNHNVALPDSDAGSSTDMQEVSQHQGENLPPVVSTQASALPTDSDADSSIEIQEVSQHQGENLLPAVSTQASALPTVPHASVRPRDIGARDLPVTLTVDDLLNDPDTRDIRLENPQVLDLIYRNTANISELLEYRVNGMLGLLADVALRRRSQENQNTSAQDIQTTSDQDNQNTSAQDNQNTSSQDNQSTSTQDNQNTSAQDNQNTSTQDNQNTSAQDNQSTSTQDNQTTSDQDNQNTSSQDNRNTSAQENQSTSTQDNQTTSTQDNQNTSAQDNQSTSSQDNQNTSAQDNQNTSAQDNQSTSSQDNQTTSDQDNQSSSSQDNQSTSS